MSGAFLMSSINRHVLRSQSGRWLRGEMRCLLRLPVHVLFRCCLESLLWPRYRRLLGRQVRFPGADVGLAVLLLHFGRVLQVRQRVVTGVEVGPE